MKDIITNAEIIEKAKKWIASFSNEELSKMVEDEIFLLELNKMKHLEWFKKISNTKIINDISNIKCEATAREDKRKFTWTSSDKVINDKKENISFIPDSFIEIYYGLKAA